MFAKTKIIYGKPFVSKLSIQKMCCARLQNRLDCDKNRLDCAKNRLDCDKNRLDCDRNRLDCVQNRLDCDEPTRLKKIDLIVFRIESIVTRNNSIDEPTRLSTKPTRSQN